MLDALTAAVTEVRDEKARTEGGSGMNDETFAERLLMEERVAVIPGSAFGEAGAGHVRICYAQRYELLEDALDRVRRFVDRNRPGAR